MRDYLIFYVNGREHRVSGGDAFKTLSNFLRCDERASGTKIVCEEGDCGACSVLVGRVEKGALKYRPINSCIQFLYQLDLTHVITVEGLKISGELNPVQEAMVRCHGAQCGFCTPGFIVSLSAMFEERDKVSQKEVKDALTGNLCRCTGYLPIMKAALEVDTARLLRANELYPPEAMLAAFREHASRPVLIKHAGRTIFAPVDVPQTVKFKSENEGALLVAGATDVGVNCNKKGLDPRVTISLAGVQGIDDLHLEDGTLVVGARTALANLEAFVKDLVPELYEILWTFGGPGIKHAGTLAGNIANGSPIADTLPFLFVTGAEVELCGVKDTRRVPVGALYKGYKKLDLNPDELITRVFIPLPRPGQTLKLYKVSRRKNLDISAFTAAFLIDRVGDNIKSIRIAYGGVAAVVLRLARTEEFLAGKPYSLAVFEEAGRIAREEITPISDVRGSADFRFRLAETILLKLYYETAGEKELACHQ